MTTESIQVCRVIVSCNTLTQLTGAERYMIFAGKDFTNLVDAKRRQLLDNVKFRARTNKAMNDRLNSATKPD